MPKEISRPEYLQETQKKMFLREAQTLRVGRLPSTAGRTVQRIEMEKVEMSETVLYTLADAVMYTTAPSKTLL